jgi:hypothetical protein
MIQASDHVKSRLPENESVVERTLQKNVAPIEIGATDIE